MISLYSLGLHYIIAYYLAWIWLCMVCVKMYWRRESMSFILNCIIQGTRWTTDCFMYVLSKNDEWMAHTLFLSLSPSLFSEPTIFPLKGIYSRRRTQRKRWCPDLTRYTITRTLRCVSGCKQKVRLCFICQLCRLRRVSWSLGAVNREGLTPGSAELIG